MRLRDSATGRGRTFKAGAGMELEGPCARQGAGERWGAAMGWLWELIDSTTVDDLSCKTCVRKLQSTFSSGEFLSCCSNVRARVSKVLGNELTTVGEADDSIEKRKESQGDERARRWMGLVREVTRGAPSRNHRATVWSKATGEWVSWPVPLEGSGTRRKVGFVTIEFK